jgi:hypothetical protein
MKNKAVKLNRFLNYKIVAVGFNSKNEFLGIKTNGFGEYKYSRKGTGKHAERELIKKYGRRLSKIVILRIGKSGDVLPIEPCEVCKKVAQKNQIEI